MKGPYLPEYLVFTNNVGISYRTFQVGRNCFADSLTEMHNHRYSKCIKQIVVKKTFAPNPPTEYVFTHQGLQEVPHVS